ncbi:MAG TPA: UDP-3-O-(3-hydroxymyristoyl)glucosamine N-acyltransferase [Bacteroidia bacterium]|nr:UDP-3-O-(3-hydroxymyristoyl)glucosamine N-acyltransferase [Bacteroidia bacterium]
MKLKSLFTVADAATLLNITYAGNGEQTIEGINEIHCVEKGDLTFVDHPKYYDKALQSAATIILINKEVEVPAGKSILISPVPFDDYNKLTRKFMPFRASSKMISDSAVIGSDTFIFPSAFVGNNVTIGSGCTIHPGVCLYDNSVIGNNVTIHANTVIGADAFYFKRKPEGYDKMYSCGRVVLGNNVEIGAMCTIDKGVSADTIIGDGTKMDDHVHIGHDTVVGNNCLFAAFAAVAGVTKIEDNVIIWGQVGIQKDIVIGKGTEILAQSGVGKSTAPGSKVFGSPAVDAREKMKELVMIKRLPDLFKNQS